MLDLAVPIGVTATDMRVQKKASEKVKEVVYPDSTRYYSCTSVRYYIMAGNQVQ